MRLVPNKKKRNNKLKAIIWLPLVLVLMLFAYNNKQQLIRAFVHVNGGSVYNDYLDTKFDLTEFWHRGDTQKRMTLIVETGSSNYVKLQKERAKKTKDYILQGGMIRTETNFYNSRVQIGNGKSKAKVGLYGGASDNFRDSNGFHFRLKMDGGTNFGKKVYNVLKPKSRGYNSDALLSIIYEKLFNGLGIDYEPVNVVFNKSSFGVYLMEEYFDKYLIESKSFREGMIFKIMSKDSIKFKHIPDVLDATSKLNMITAIVENRDGSQLAKLIDEEKMLGYLALSFVYNQTHGSTQDNLHFFYNSVTNKLEPFVREFDIAPYNQIPTFEEMLAFQCKTNFAINDWVQYRGVKNVEAGVKTAFSKIKSNIGELLEDPKYLQFKNKLIGFKSEMRNQETILLDNLERLDFLFHSPTPTPRYKVSIKKDTVISDDFIVAKNEDLTIEKGVSITLNNNASLFVYGSVSANGTGQYPIFITSSGKSSSSIFIHSNEMSRFNHTTFSNLSALDRKLWQLPASITAYETKIAFENCTFESNLLGDDMLNLFRCGQASLDHCRFLNILSDAIDTDFSNIDVSNSVFEKIGNDAVDGSGSRVIVSHSVFSEVGDKVISAGEASMFTTNRNTIRDSELGLVCKDGSTLISNNDLLSNNTLDLVMFVKKKYYEQPIVELKGTKINSNLVEKKVRLVGINIPKNVSKGVKDKLYGNEFGKSSD